VTGEAVEAVSPAVLKAALALVASGLGADDESSDERPPYTVPEAARRLRVHDCTVYRAIQERRLRAYSVGSKGRAIRIPADALDAFMAAGMISEVAS
jgi:excisionase family DNA binding protein